MSDARIVLLRLQDIISMDITRSEQRILHLLAQGGWIEHSRNHKAKIAAVKCFSRDGWLYSGLDLDVFRRLKRLKAISSSRRKLLTNASCTCPISDTYPSVSSIPASNARRCSSDARR